MRSKRQGGDRDSGATMHFFLHGLLLLCLLPHLVHAVTHHGPPITQVEIPEETRVERVIRGCGEGDLVAAEDHIRITLGSFGERLYLHLRPSSRQVIHESATFTVLDGEGRVLDRQPIRAEDHRLYQGVVIRGDEESEERRHDDLTRTHWDASEGHHLPPRITYNGTVLDHPSGLVGWARIILHDQGSELDARLPSFEGVFAVDGEVYQIKEIDAYEQMRLRTEPNNVPVRHELHKRAGKSSPRLVIHRDSLQQSRAGLERSFGARECQAHQLHEDIRARQVRPLQEGPLAPFYPVYSAYDEPFRRNALYGRSIMAGDISSTGSSATTADLRGVVGSTNGCTSSMRFMYVGVAADALYYAANGNDQTRTRTAILNDFNSANALYQKSFNVTLGVIDLRIFTSTATASTTDGSQYFNQPCSSSTDLNFRLSGFSQWRGLQNADAGIWHLFTSCLVSTTAGSSTPVGVAWLGTACQTGSTQSNGSYYSGTGLTSSNSAEWAVVSHEIGHNFGASHDCATGCTDTSCCPLTSNGACDAGGKYIMSPSTDSAAATGETFSPCSVGQICGNIGQSGSSSISQCLADSNTKTLLSLQSCGNGVLEAGEECDTGGTSTSCCDASTCKLIGSAKCEPFNAACCTSSCQIQSSGVVCRPSIDSQCDYAETCDGTSSLCPADKREADGSSCSGPDSAGELACASGRCTSRDLQCQQYTGAANYTSACPNRDDTTCQVTCQSTTQSNICDIMGSQFLDGTSCGYGGKCYSGTCQKGSTWDTIQSWYAQNKNISIPVTIVVGLVILFLLFALARLLWGCFRRKDPKVIAAKRRRQRRKESARSRGRDGAQQRLMTTANVAPSPTKTASHTPDGSSAGSAALPGSRARSYAPGAALKESRASEDSSTRMPFLSAQDTPLRGSESNDSFHSFGQREMGYTAVHQPPSQLPTYPAPSYNMQNSRANIPMRYDSMRPRPGLAGVGAGGGLTRSTVRDDDHHGNSRGRNDRGYTHAPADGDDDYYDPYNRSDRANGDATFR